MSAGLSNADFRLLLATPRPGGGGTGGGDGGGGGEDKQQKKQKKPKPFKPGGKLGLKEGEEDDGDTYRDRAAERRNGVAADFEGVPDDLVGLLAGQGDLRGKLSYEDSKYLGGDVAHTHLVKGLDFALLHKVRSEQQSNAKKGGGDSDGEDAPVLAKRVQLPTQAEQVAATFQTPLGRSVHAFFFDPRQSGPALSVADLFLPRRTAFVFELDDADAPDVPTTLRRSKEDCPKVQEMMLGGLDSGVLDRIAKIMSYMTVQGGGKKKLKRREREALLQQHGIQVHGQLKHQSAAAASVEEGAAGAGEPQRPAARAAAAAAPVDEDDDIFGDAGTDYQPTVKDKQRAAAAAAAAEVAEQRRGGYFGQQQEDLHADLPPLPQDDGDLPPPLPADDDLMGPSAGPARPPAGYDAAAAYAPYPEAGEVQEDAAAVARQEKVKDKHRAADVLGGDDDAYAECYPSYYDHGTVLEDSDEEGARPEAEQQPMTRRDFASEADWEEYQASGMPSRQAEGRAKMRLQQREESKGKNKIQSQLGKIQKIMEDKGYDHAAAFSKQREVEAAAKGGGGGDSGAAFRAAQPKKRRI